MTTEINLIELIENKEDEDNSEISELSGLLESGLLGQRLFQAISEGVLLVDPATDEIIEANPASEQIFGYSREKLLGRLYQNLLRPEAHLLYAKQKKAIEAGEVVQGHLGALHQDGYLLYLKVSGSHMLYRGKPHILQIIQEVARQNNPPEITKAEQKSSLVRPDKVSQSIFTTPNEVMSLMGLLLHQLKLKMNYSSSAIFGVQDLEFKLLNYTSHLVDQANVPFHSGIIQVKALHEMLWKRQPVVIKDIWNSPLLKDFLKDWPKERLKENFKRLHSWAIFPIIAEEQVVGAISLAQSQPDYFSPDHVKFAQNVIIHAIQARSRLYGRVQSEAIYEERQRMARELHDSVTQVFYGIELEANSARALLKRGDNEQVGQQIEGILQLAEAGLAEMRALLLELRPESLETEGLVGALQKQRAALQVRYNLKIETELGQEPDLPVETKEVLYRIAQEALQNVVKHGQATKINLRLIYNPDLVILEVEDDGRGFDPAGAFPGHMGLITMNERARKLGGTLFIESEPGQGTHVFASIPLQK